MKHKKKKKKVRGNRDFRRLHTRKEKAEIACEHKTTLCRTATLTERQNEKREVLLSSKRKEEEEEKKKRLA